MRLPIEPRRRDFNFSCLPLNAARAARESCGLRVWLWRWAMKRELRTKSVGTKVSEAELRVLESRAERAA